MQRIHNMLLPVDLMSIVGAGSSAANGRDAGSGSSGTAPSWLMAADTGMSEESGNDLINKIFLSYSGDGEADPAARFAADLKALLHAHGVSLSPNTSLLSGVANPIMSHQAGESTETTWSVDELLQMSMNPLAGGNSLPLTDQTLPSVLSNWLAALTTSGEQAPTETLANGLSAGTTGGVLSGAAGPDSEQAAVGAAPGALLLATAGGTAEPATGGLASVAIDSLSGGSATVPAGASPLADSAVAMADAEPLSASVLSRVDGSGNPSSDQDPALRAVLLDDAARRAAEAVQVSPGSQKVSADAANASAFRSIQFNQPASGEMSGADDAALLNQPDLSKAGGSQERTQTMVSQWAAALNSSSTEAPASSGSPQLVNATDGGALVNRSDQRMFATETAQQAQSQAAQHTATRTADGLPRFAMDTAFGQQGWSDSLGRQLLVMSSQGLTSAQIRLDPPELGSLTVKIQMSADQQASVSFVSQHAAVREALEQQLNRLQDLFRDQGLNLQDVSVSDQSPQQQEGQDQGQQRRGRNTGSGDQDAIAAEPVIVRSESLIDYYA